MLGSMRRLMRRAWPWVGLVVSLVLVAAGYFRPELGAGRQIGFVRALLGWERPTAELLVTGVRKLGHVAGYAVIALSLKTLLRRRGFGSRRLVWWTLLTAAAIAILDELIQSRISWRRGSVTDVLLDLAAALAVGLVRSPQLERVRSRRSPDPDPRAD